MKSFKESPIASPAKPGKEFEDLQDQGGDDTKGQPRLGALGEDVHFHMNLHYVVSRKPAPALGWGVG
jgi:hypothetical protein